MLAGWRAPGVCGGRVTVSTVRVSRTIVVLMVCASFSLPAVAGVRSDAEDTPYLELAAQFPSVGAVLFNIGSDSYLGSGTLITSGNPGGDWVLTAGHCVDEATSVTFVMDPDLRDGWSEVDTYGAASWLAHPDWTGDLSLGSDIGLIQLADQITGIQPAMRNKGKGELGAVGTMVGYGMTGTGDLGATEDAGTRRAGQNAIDQLFLTVGKTPNVFAYDFDSGSTADNSFGSSSQVDLEYLTSFGDSGGPTFIRKGPNWLLAGVHSFVVDENGDGLWCNYGDWAGDTRVSVFNGWIDDMIGGDGGGGGHGGGKPPWAGGPKKGFSGDTALQMAVVPEPASLGLLALGALLGLRRRRRS